MSGNDIAYLAISGAAGLGMISVVCYLGVLAIIKPQERSVR